MAGLLVTLPLHLACQLISTGYPVVGNVTIVEDTSAPKLSTVLPTGYTVFPDIGVAYKFYGNKLTWNSARKQCMAEGASLAIVDSFRKIEYIMGFNKKEGIYTGIHRSFDNTEWTNVKNGQTMGFVPWRQGVSFGTVTEKCVAMWGDGSGVGPHNCNVVLASVCEIPVSKNDFTADSELRATLTIE